ncbi:MAG: 50S ribosomal protein L25 [Candidatus Krumholzibacteria bacterium]
MAQNVTVVAERRLTKGKGAAREMRRNGKLPAVIYGRGRKPESLAISHPVFEKEIIALHGDIKSTLFNVDIEGTKVTALIRELQRHPSRLDILHVDFYEIHAGEKITLAVPIHLVGSPEGVRSADGVLDQILWEIRILVLPKDIPEHVDVDTTELGVGHSLHVRDISIPEAIVLTDPDKTVCTVVPPRIEVEEVEEPVEEVEGEEPELIRKPQAEDEEAEETPGE